MLVSTSSTSVIEGNKEAILVNNKELKQVMYIQYPIGFQGNVTQVRIALDPKSALFDLSNEVNVMHPAFTEKLDLVVRSTNIGT